MSVIITSGVARAQGGDGPGGVFDAGSVETLSGEVASIDTATRFGGSGVGVHLTLQSGEETISVHLGPQWYLERQDLQLAPGDEVVVTGSRVLYEQQPAIIAVLVRRGDDALELRDANGFPRWSGWRRADRTGRGRGIGRGTGGFGPSSPYGRLYDPRAVETLVGQIAAIEVATAGSGAGGVHLMVRTDRETIAVHLGPEWYVDNQDASLDVGDRVEVTGSRTTYEGAPAIIAAVVRKGDDVLELRDERGYPRWAGWRRQPRR